jgi:hypothetical protein
LDLDLGARGVLVIGVGSVRNQCVQHLFAHKVCIEQRIDSRVPFGGTVLEPGDSHGICLFCGSDLDLLVPGALTMIVSSGRNQSWPMCAHAACIEQRLDPQVPFLGSAFESDDSA